MGYENILFEVDGPVAVIKVNRPEKLNALDSETLGELADALETAGRDPEVSVVVLTGEGRAFVAGADISEMAAMGPREALEFARLGHRVGEIVERLPKPVIAAVNGFALGGGCELALSCDFIHASSKAKFGQPEVKLGVIPGHGGTQRLMRRVGRAMAAEMILTGRIYTAEQAKDMGLVNQVHEPDRLMPAVMELAREMADMGPLALAAAKELLRVGEGLDLPAANELERITFANLFATHDQKEGMAAFMEKRAPRFEGK